MQVYREGIHKHHFTGQGAHNGGCVICEAFVVTVPWVARVKMAINAPLCPVVELGFNGFARAFRLQTQRIAGEVEHFAAVNDRKVKLRAEVAQWIGRVALVRIGGGEGIAGCGCFVCHG